MSASEPDIAAAFGDHLSPGDYRHPDSLDAAWQEAEAALPEGWHVGEVKNVAYRGAGQRWIAMAWEFTADPDYMTYEHGYGDTPVLALRALAARAAPVPEEG